MAWDENQGVSVGGSAPAQAWHEDQGVPAEIGQKATAGTMSPADTAKFLRENPDLAGWEPGGAKIRAAQVAAQPRTVDTTGGLGAPSQQDTAKVAAPVAPPPDLSPKNAVQSAYQATRNAMSYLAAGPTTGAAYLASRLSKEYPGLPARPSLGEIYGQTQAAGSRGEGFTGLLADPINAAAVATQFIPGFDIPGAAWLASKAPLVARAARAAQAAKEAYPVVTDLARATAQGAAQGAGWSGAQNLMDPNLQYTPLGESLTSDAVLGGAAGLAGRGAQLYALDHFPGITSLQNKNIPQSGKDYVKDNLEDILRVGILPTGREGLMQQSIARQAALSPRYEKAIQAVEEAHPDLLIPTSEWRDMAKEKLINELGEWNRGGLVRDPTSRTGVGIPEAAKNIFDEAFANAEATKIHQANKALGGLTVGDINDFTVANPINTANFVKTVTQSLNKSQLTKGKLRGFTGRGISKGPAGPTVGDAQEAFGSAYAKTAARDALAKAEPTAVQARVSAQDPTGDKLQGFINDVVDAYRSPSAATEGPAAAAKLHDWIAGDLTPRQLSLLRTAATDPIAWKDPSPPLQRLRKDIANAIHKTANKRLMQIEEYAKEMGPVSDRNKVLRSGSVPQRFALDATLQNILEHPGPVGLSDRFNLWGIFNGAVTPWFKASTGYKAGGLLRAAGISPFTTDEARRLYDAARNKP